MAVAGYVLDDDQPPPELTRALNYRSWGVADVMMLPAGMLPRMNTSLAYYNALVSYRSAPFPKNPWIEKNPDDWDLVTRVLNWRIEEHKGQ
jgi:hypothetical protein